jgi:hypothetical protein
MVLMGPQELLDLTAHPEKREKLDQTAQMVLPELRVPLEKMDTTEHRDKLDLKENLGHLESLFHQKSPGLLALLAILAKTGLLGHLVAQDHKAFPERKDQ